MNNKEKETKGRQKQVGATLTRGAREALELLSVAHNYSVSNLVAQAVDAFIEEHLSEILELKEKKVKAKKSVFTGLNKHDTIQSIQESA